MAITKMPEGWELVVGLEVHVELNTKSKMFSASPTDFGGEPNTRVFPIDAGLPGTLPVINETAVRSAAWLGLALNCGVAPTCRMHRKNYFYPDLPKGYQISQYDVPICHDGWMDLEVEGESRHIRIERLHMEEDTGKSMHVGVSGRLHGADRSLIDYNRAGIPLLEIVSHPDIHDPETAQAYVRELQGIVLALGVSDARMEEGSMRCDANVSVRRPGEPLGTRTEIKNVNSIRSIGHAIAFEAQRQIDEITAGNEIIMETRHWDESKSRTDSLRKKESVADYRYFPDPDLVEIVCTPEWVEDLKSKLPELPKAARDRIEGIGVKTDVAATIVGNGLLVMFDEAVAAGADPVKASNWLTGELLGQISVADVTLEESGVTGAHLGDLLRLVDDGTLSNNMAKQVLEGVIEARGTSTPSEVADAKGLKQVSDTGALQGIIDTVVANNATTVEQIQGGNAKAIGALVGQVMKETRGQANPKLVNEMLQAAING